MGLALRLQAASRDSGSPAQAPAPSAQPAIKLSSKAGKAIIELQKAVKANDVASIPAKLAAAQAVAQTKDDKYAIGKLQLDAALAAKDNAQAIAAADAIAASGFLAPARPPKSTTRLEFRFTTPSNMIRPPRCSRKRPR